MGEADRDLHFACPKCTARLTAPRRRAGTKGRCPWCQNVFTVPLENRLPFAGEAYTLEDPSRHPPKFASANRRCGHLPGVWHADGGFRAAGG